MKRLLFGLALLVAGCEAVHEEEESIIGHKVFYGSMDDESSRTFINEKIQLRWVNGDLVTIFEGTTRNQKYINLCETGENMAEFDYVRTGFGSGNDLNPLRNYSIYPYTSTNRISEEGVLTYTFPQSQTYAANSFGPQANPMVAVTADADDTNLRFRNVGAYLRVRLYGVEQTVGSIVVTSKGDEPLAGKALITPTYGGEPTTTMSSTTKSVTLTCADPVTIGTSSEDATAFWIVLPAATYAQGLTITVNGYYGGSQSFEINGPIQFVRNQYKNMTRELTIASSGTGMGLGGWGDGENVEEEI